LYNHVHSIHLGEKTNCPDCKNDISVEFTMSNLSSHIRQVHNTESTECPDCGKALTISNLNKHIESVQKEEWSSSNS
jgi:transcription initiation factor IIE alpha subunit